jgi:hypothetical protein
VIGHASTYRQAHGRLTLSVITAMEMVKGLQQVQRPQKITDLLTLLLGDASSCWSRR